MRGCLEGLSRLILKCVEGEIYDTFEILGVVSGSALFQLPQVDGPHRAAGAKDLGFVTTLKERRGRASSEKKQQRPERLDWGGGRVHVVLRISGSHVPLRPVVPALPDVLGSLDPLTRAGGARLGPFLKGRVLSHSSFCWAGTLLQNPPGKPFVHPAGHMRRYDLWCARFF